MLINRLAETLRCPETRQRLSVAPPEVIEWMRGEQAAGKLFCQSGKYAVGDLQAGLLREDGRLFYPVVNDIPVMARDEAIMMRFNDEVRMTESEKKSE